MQSQFYKRKVGTVQYDGHSNELLPTEILEVATFIGIEYSCNQLHIKKIVIDMS